MEVRSQCKQTELGTVPETWDICSLGGIAEKITVGIASAATHAYRSTGVPLLRNQNIKPGRLDDSDVLFVDPAYEDAFRSKRLRAGDLLTARTGYPGMTCVVPPAYESAQSFTTLITRPLKTRADATFLCAIINSDWGQRFFDRTQIGGAQKNVNAATLRTMPIPLPPLTEQRLIAAASVDLDSLLGGFDRLIAKKRDLKQAAMQQLLTGRTRLPGFRGEWPEKQLGDLADMASGGTPPSDVAAYYDGDIPWVSISDMTTRGRVITETERCLTRAGYDACAARMFPSGTVLYAMYASLGECSLAGVPLCSSQAILGIRPRALLSSEFLFYWLIHQRTRVRTIGQHGTQANLSKAMVREFVLPLPSLAEQQAVAAALSDIENELEALEARREKTRLLKQGMMQELLTGRIRLV